MAEIVTPTNLQKMEFDVSTAEGPGRVTVVTGDMPVSLTSTGGLVTRDFRAQVDPTLTAAQFRRATAILALSSSSVTAPPPVTAPPSLIGWNIGDVQANFDDEAGKVQIEFEVTANVEGPSGTYFHINTIAFQVTTLAMV
jgi:hypothetical protein